MEKKSCPDAYDEGLKDMLLLCSNLSEMKACCLLCILQVSRGKFESKWNRLEMMMIVLHTWSFLFMPKWRNCNFWPCGGSSVLHIVASSHLLSHLFFFIILDFNRIPMESKEREIGSESILDYTGWSKTALDKIHWNTMEIQDLKWEKMRQKLICWHTVCVENGDVQSQKKADAESRCSWAFFDSLENVFT